MHTYKKLRLGLLIFVLAGLPIFSILLGTTPAYAQSDEDYGNADDATVQKAEEKATAFCTSPVTGLNPRDVCEKAFKAGTLAGGQNQADFCSRFSANRGVCSTAYSKGAADPTIDKSGYPSQCQGWRTVGELRACKDGADSKKLFKDRGRSCDEYSGREKQACEGGWNNTENTVTDEMKQACDEYKDHITNRSTCYTGFASGKAGQSEAAACRNDFIGDSLKICLVGFKAGNSVAAGGEDNKDACYNNSNITLEWIFCPLIVAISEATDQLNDEIEDQLNFDTKNFLPDDGGVHMAWNVIKNIVTSVLVILMLFMVISQAIGGGVFDAYTVKKVMPRLVIAVIAMQLSWELCIWLINLVNSLGEGLKQLITAPFGGPDNLSLEELLKRLSGPWLTITGAGLTAMLVSAIFLGAVFLPGVLLIIFMALMTVFIALATLLLRNVLIIACVILVPVALLLWVLPNSGVKRYWNLWSDNFIKLLLLFPLMVAIIYSGRIFAWIVGDLGRPGFFDLIMLMVGFFGVYAILPKSFKWGGSAMSTASRAINDSKAVSKGRGFGMKELGDWQKRRIGEKAKELDPSKDGYASARRFQRGPLKGRPYGWRGNLGSTMKENVRAGRLMPTKRGLAVAIKKGDQWSSEEDEIALARVKREQDKGTSHGSMSYGLNAAGQIEGSLETSTQGGKAAIFKNAGSSDMRVAGMAVDQALKTQSYVEMAKSWVPLENEDLAIPGAEIKHDADGNAYARMFETKRFVSKVNSSPDLFGMTTGKFPLSMPFMVTMDPNTSGAKAQAKLQTEENTLAAKEGRAARTIEKPDLQAARAIGVIRDYTDAEGIRGQSEAMLGEYARLSKKPGNSAVSDEFANLLARFVAGGQTGQQALGHLSSSASMIDTVNKILQQAHDASGNKGTLTIDQFLDASKKNLPPPNRAAAAAATGTPAAGTPAGAGTPTPGTPTPGAPAPAPAPTPGTPTPGTPTPGAPAPAPAPAPGTPATPGSGAINYDQLGETMADAVARGMQRHQRQSGGDKDPSVMVVPHNLSTPQKGEAETASGLIVPRGDTADELRQKRNPPGGGP